MTPPTPIGPVDVRERFRPLTQELVRLLRGLPSDAWHLATTAGTWNVRDVAAHLLDGDLRRIAAQRDGHAPPPSRSIRSYRDLTRHLDDLNAQWVDTTRRLSPTLLTDLLAYSGNLVSDMMEKADSTGAATFPVAWAGQDASPMWLDLGREYTERWHHQDQIREAVGSPPLSGEAWLHPVIQISLHALPHAYRELDADDGTRVALAVDGPAGGRWILERHGDGWRVLQGETPGAHARIATADLDLARLLLHRLDARQAAGAIQVTGDRRLAEPLLRARAVMV